MKRNYGVFDVCWLYNMHHSGWENLHGTGLNPIAFGDLYTSYLYGV